MAQLKESTLSGNLDITGNVSATEASFDNLSVNGYYFDYIVEQGTSGIWYYRKWNSGMAEIWGMHYVYNVAINVAWGNLYESAVLTLPDFPFAFTSIPFGQATWQNGTCAAMLEYFQPSKTNGGITYLCRPTSYIGSGYISMYCWGRWK